MCTRELILATQSRYILEGTLREHHLGEIGSGFVRVISSAECANFGLYHKEVDGSRRMREVGYGAE